MAVPELNENLPLFETATLTLVWRACGSTGLRSRSPSIIPGRERCALIVNMIVGSGIDLVEIDRIQRAVDRFGARFLDRVYTQAEQAYCLRQRPAAESLAVRFAAKEAGAKALGTGISQGVNWLEIEVVREPGGRPGIRFHGRAALRAATMRAARAALSLTHSKDLAMASVVLESDE